LSEWTTFVQGLLLGGGYDARIVTHAEGAGSSTSLLVGLSLPSGRVAYVPVIVNLPSDGRGLGDVAWVQEGVAFDPRYASFTGVLPPSTNAVPSFAVIVPHRPVAGAVADFLISAADPEGDLVGFVWAVDGVTIGAEARRAMAYRFPEAGDHVVTCTAYDRGGASASETLKVFVLSEAPSCNCHD
jgi:hypothetical protein